MSIYVTCRCGQAFHAPPEVAGQTLPCPVCQQPIAIPRGGDDTEYRLASEPQRPANPFQQAMPSPQWPPVPQQQWPPPPSQTRPPASSGTFPTGATAPPKPFASQHPAAVSNGPSALKVLGIISGVGVGGLMLLCVCGGLLVGFAGKSNTGFENEAGEGPKTLREARAGFQTAFFRNETQRMPVDPPPPAVFQLVSYPTPNGMLPAYLTPMSGDGLKRPAIIWITGGDCNSIGDVWSPADPENDQTAAQYRSAGIVMMFPGLRGGNQSPGTKEWYCGEVDDVVSAADFLAQQSHVDPSRIYLGGHSTGGTLALLVAETSDRFRAVFSFGPADEVTSYPSDYYPFDNGNKREASVRSPIHWLAGVTRPTFVIEGATQGNASSIRTMSRKNKNPLVQLMTIRGRDHFSVLAPANQLLAEKINADTGPTCNITITEEDKRRIAR